MAVEGLGVGLGAGGIVPSKNYDEVIIISGCILSFICHYIRLKGLVSQINFIKDLFPPLVRPVLLVR